MRQTSITNKREIVYEWFEDDPNEVIFSAVRSTDSAAILSGTIKIHDRQAVEVLDDIVKELKGNFIKFKMNL